MQQQVYTEHLNVEHLCYFSASLTLCIPLVCHILPVPSAGKAID